MLPFYWCRNGQQYGEPASYEAYVASNVQYQASTDPEYQALLSQRQQLQDPDAEAAMVPISTTFCPSLKQDRLLFTNAEMPRTLVVLVQDIVQYGEASVICVQQQRC